MADRACVVLLEHGHVLMVQQTYRGKTFWTFPGGGIEPGETPEAAAVREAQEEAGLDIHVLRLLYQAPRATTDGTYYCYLGRIVGGTAALGQDPELPVDAQELHALRLFPLHELRDHPEVVRIWESLASLVPHLGHVP